MKKGISLPVETTVIIVLAVIVLVALLFFFSTSVNPGIDRIKMEGQRADLCTKYVANNKECRGSPSGDVAELNKVCKSLGTPVVRACCATFCPQITTKAECEANNGNCAGLCSQSTTGLTVELGRCNDDTAKPYCCIAPS
ncbi:MAG: hypothetical protein HYT72_02060 [Candidatus Aenigmarchaeota archaeon]|nr:hypothetical protein [Candidatus Aenigmarchaeota archaeon]